MSQTVTLDARMHYENTFRRQMLSVLTPAETKVLVYIIDRTLGWLRLSERFSYREFKSGCQTSRGANIDKDTAMRCLDSLTEKNVIQVLSRSKKRGTEILLNLKWSIEDMLRQPKKDRSEATGLRQSRHSGSSVSAENRHQCLLHGDTSVCSEQTPYINKDKGTIGRETNVAGSASSESSSGLQPVSLTEVISAAKEKNATAATRVRSRMKDSARSGTVSAQAMERFWVDGIKENDSAAVYKSWTKKEAGQAYHLRRGLNMPGEQLLEFMRFCGREWKGIIRTQFSWARSEQATIANVGFLLKYPHQFVHAFQNQHLLKVQEGVALEDTRVARMVAAGRDEDDVRQELASARQRREAVKADKAPAAPRKRFVQTDSLARFRQGELPVRQRREPKDAPSIPAVSMSDALPMVLDDLPEWVQ